MARLTASSLGLSDPLTPAQLLAQAGLREQEISTASSPKNEIPEETQEADFQHSEVVEFSRTNLDFLAGLAMPEIYKYAFPDIYLTAWALITSKLLEFRDFTQFALGLPRGFAKTLVIKLLVLWAILFTKKRFIIIICENEEKAISILSDVFDMLNELNIKSVYGEWKSKESIDQRAKKVFGFRGRDIIVKGVGAGTGIRGITEKNRRPDFMIFDDIQSREDAESELLSSNLEKWMVGTAMKAKSPEGCLFLFVANMYPTKGSLLRKFQSNPNWIKFIVGGILQDGTSLWEELQPISQLLKEFQNDLEAGHPEIFYAEVLNDPTASVNTSIDLSKIPDYKYDDGDIPGGKFIIVDPSNDKVGSDDVGIIYFEVHDGYAQAMDVFEGKLSPEDTILKSLEMCFKHGCSLVIIEANGFQYSLQYWFNFICLQRGILGIEVRDIYSGMVSKSGRILAMFKQLSKGELGLHPSVRNQCFLQIMQYNPLRRDNTDGLLDCLTYGPRAIEMYPGEILAGNTIAEQEYGTLQVLEYNHAF